MTPKEAGPTGLFTFAAFLLGIGLGIWIAWKTNPAQSRATSTAQITVTDRKPSGLKATAPAPKPCDSSSPSSVSKRTEGGVKESPISVSSEGFVAMSAVDRMTFSEFQSYCRSTEDNFRLASVESFAPYAYQATDEEHENLKTWSNRKMRAKKKISKYWLGHFEHRGEKGSVLMDYLLDFMDEKDDMSCFNLNASVTVDGAPLEAAIGRFGCAGMLRRRGDGFYSDFDLYADKQLGPHFNFILVPVPLTEAPLFYLESNQTEWKSAEFTWQPMTEEEYNNRRSREQR